MTHEELILKAKEARSVEELLLLAKDNGVELSEADAKMYLEMNKSGELSDDALSDISGGAAYTLSGGYLIVTNFHECDRWECDSCGYSDFKWKTVNGRTDWVHTCGGYKYGCGKSCSTCKYMTYRFPFQICTHPETRK